MKWHILNEVPSYAPRKQSKIILACCALHNFIRSGGIKDKHFGRCESGENSVPRKGTEEHDEEKVVSSCMHFVSPLHLLCFTVQLLNGMYCDGMNAKWCKSCDLQSIVVRSKYWT
jgi:hypothetical protein